MKMNTQYVWNERYENEKYGLEQKSSFKYFQEYLKEPKPRNLKEFHSKLSDKLSENGRKKIPTYKSLCDYSHKWKWNKRAEAYDSYIQNAEDEEMRELFKDIKRENMENARSRLNYQNQLLNDIKADEDLTTKDKAYASARNSEAYNNEIRSLTELYNEGKEVQEIEADVNTSNSIEVKPKSVFEELNELDNELSEVYADNEDKQGTEQ